MIELNIRIDGDSLVNEGLFDVLIAIQNLQNSTKKNVKLFENEKLIKEEVKEVKEIKDIEEVKEDAFVPALKSNKIKKAKELFTSLTRTEKRIRIKEYFAELDHSVKWADIENSLKTDNLDLDKLLQDFINIEMEEI